MDNNGRIELRVEIAVEDNRGDLHAVQVVVDTGFTGLLALPTDFIRRLGLPRVDSREATLADGSIGLYDYYDGRILWHDRPLSADIVALDAAPLLGTRLLADCRLTVEFRDGGAVSIEEIPPPA